MRGRERESETNKWKDAIIFILCYRFVLQPMSTIKLGLAEKQKQSDEKIKTLEVHIILQTLYRICPSCSAVFKILKTEKIESIWIFVSQNVYLWNWRLLTFKKSIRWANMIMKLSLWRIHKYPLNLNMRCLKKSLNFGCAGYIADI